jgi:acetylcholinesterase
MESSANHLTNYPWARRREDDFGYFLGNITQCASFAKNQAGAFDCLRSANLTGPQLILATGLAYVRSEEELPFPPTLGDDIFPALPSVGLAAGNYSRIPFLTGTNLDEGTSFVPSPGSVGPKTSKLWLYANYTPTLVDGYHHLMSLRSDIRQLLKLYPDDPIIGSPYGTGNETFGFDSNYKRLASIRMWLLLLIIDAHLYRPSQRRFVPSTTPLSPTQNVV